MSRPKTMRVVVVSLALFAAAFAAVGEDEKSPPTDRANVLITLTISKTGGTGPGEKVYKMIGQDGSDANMMVGWRTPIPTTSAAKDESGKGAHLTGCPLLAPSRCRRSACTLSPQRHKPPILRKASSCVSFEPGKHLGAYG